MPTPCNGMQDDGTRNRRISEPVRDSPPAKVGNAGGQRENDGKNPESLVHGSSGDSTASACPRTALKRHPAPKGRRWENRHRGKLELLCSAIIFLAFSAKARACGNRSSPFRTSGSVSAFTFNPSSWPKASTNISLLMLERIQSLFCTRSASVYGTFSASSDLRKSCTRLSSTSKFLVTLWPTT